MVGDSFTYMGVKGTMIKHNSNSGIWEVANQDALGGFAASLSSYALGTHKWNAGKNCMDGKGSDTLTVSLSSCLEDQFTCGDGSCTVLENRCNGEVDCLHGLDEIDCLTVDINEFYNSHLPPSNQMDNFVINVSVTVYDILEINENKNTFRSKQQIDLSWKDPRLDFLNLKSDKFKNKLSKDSFDRIWTPELMLEDINLYTRDINEPIMVLADKEVDLFTKESVDMFFNGKRYYGNGTVLHKTSITRYKYFKLH